MARLMAERLVCANEEIILHKSAPRQQAVNE